MTRIETERLVLRRWREEDFEPYAAIYADPAASGFIGGPCDRAAAWRRFAAELGHWELRGFGNWALEETGSGRFVGACGPWLPEGWPELELGYWLLPDAHGKGYATEAARAARDHVYDVLRAPTLVSYIAPENVASKHVAERLGARSEATIDLCGFGPHEVFRHPGPGDLG